jgi:ABC-2 type transport system ATP-binding protein
VTGLLAVEAVTKSFGDRRVVDALSFRVDRGEIYGLLGPNGAGKSTTIDLLCGLLTPDSGRVVFASGSASSVGLVPQELALYLDLTVEDNLRFFARLYGLGRREAAERIAQLLGETGLTDRAASLVSQLSGGMKRKLNIASSLLHRPELVVLDEPTAGVDIEARFAIWELVRRLRASGVGVLLTTHALEEAEELCTRVGFLNAGRLVAEGTMEELKARIPAVEIAAIRSTSPEAVEERAKSLGLAVRRRSDALHVWLPRRLPLDELAASFHGVPLSAIALEPVRLEHVYRELAG